MSDDTDTMEAGPKLDALVAVEVMGRVARQVRVLASVDTVTVYLPRPASPAEGAALTDGVWSRPDLEHYGRCPAYSTCWAAAGEVLGTFALPLLWKDASGWTCRIQVGIGDDAPLIESHAPTAPLAISRCSVKAARAAAAAPQPVPPDARVDAATTGGRE